MPYIHCKVIASDCAAISCGVYSRQQGDCFVSRNDVFFLFLCSVIASGARQSHVEYIVANKEIASCLAMTFFFLFLSHVIASRARQSHAEYAAANLKITSCIAMTMFVLIGSRSITSYSEIALCPRILPNISHIAETPP